MIKGSQKVVGIIGGMGPEATVELMRRVIELTPANDDADHIRMLVDNNPKVPSRLKALIEGGGESPLPVLIEMAQGLEKAGADFLVMPCNTAHYYYPDIVREISVPFINMIDISTSHVKQNYPNIERIGLLASSAVLKTKLYEQSLSKINIGAISPDMSDQKRLMEIIKSVKNKSITEKRIEEFIQIAKNIQTDVMLIACTELSIYKDWINQKRVVIDALDVLANKVIQVATV